MEGFLFYQCTIDTYSNRVLEMNSTYDILHWATLGMLITFVFVLLLG